MIFQELRLFLAKLLLLSACAGILFSGCSNTTITENIANGTDATTSDNTTGTNDGNDAANITNNSVAVTPGLEGTWYEQEDYGGTLVIDGDTMTYYSPYDYTFDVTYTTKKAEKNMIEIIPDEEYWIYIDIFYDPEEEVLTGHDMPHTDGDGGYHLHTFKKTEYVAPPPPVYGERTDNSNADAPKEFADYTVRSLSLQVYEPHRDSGDMAPEQPVQGWYEYELTVNEDGTGTIVSDFCKEIPFNEEDQEALKTLLAESNLSLINGINIWTEDMPEDTERYEITIEFADGAVLTSRANGADVPLEWYLDGRELHKLLFDVFTNAGYNPYTGEFHSTEPIKRIGKDPDLEYSWTIQSSLERIEREGTAYEYTVHSDYPVFTAEGDAPKALMDTLYSLTEQFKANAERDLEEEDTDMAAATESERAKSDYLYAYSFYSPEWIKSDDLLVRMFVSEGHANSLGLGQYGTGYYPNFRYNIDAQSGKILSVADFFNDTEVLADLIIEKLCEKYSSEERVNFYRSEEHRETLMDILTRPESEGGIGASPEYGHLTLYFDRQRDENGDSPYPYQLVLYYDEIQELMNDRYVSIW